MNGNKHSTHQGFDRDDAPDLSGDGWREKFANVTVRRGRPPLDKPKCQPPSARPASRSMNCSGTGDSEAGFQSTA